MSPAKPPMTTTGSPAPDDALWMARALELARQGAAQASPNPMVGAVVVRAGLAAGEGFHSYTDPRHAEIVALDATGDGARGATLYVNLEPCCTTGRTGPCTKAIVAAGIRRVVAAMADPNPAVSGRGFDELRSRGVEVAVGEAEGEARRLNEAFAAWIRTARPFVTLKSALTLDGQAGLDPRGKPGGKRADRAARWITSEESRAEVQRMRHASDALADGHRHDSGRRSGAHRPHGAPAAQETSACGARCGFANAGAFKARAIGGRGRAAFHRGAGEIRAGPAFARCGRGNRAWLRGAGESILAPCSMSWDAAKF
jgi:pyrimidine deaminase RibD-like protein